MFGIPAKYLTEERQRALKLDVKGPSLTIKAKRHLQTLSPIYHSVGETCLAEVFTGLNRKSDLVGCFGFNGPLRQYFSLYRAVSQREGERGKKG